VRILTGEAGEAFSSMTFKVAINMFYDFNLGVATFRSCHCDCDVGWLALDGQLTPRPQLSATVGQSIS
jgi:hypothetical protein